MAQPTGRKIKVETEGSVFVDRRGRRRLAVIGAGVVVTTALLGWLALMAVGIVAVVAGGPPPALPF